MQGSLGNLNSVPVYIIRNIEYRYRDFRWKLKWWQRIFNGFRKYKIIHAAVPKPIILIFGKKILANKKGLRKFKKLINKWNKE